jgi:hypothetical protein
LFFVDLLSYLFLQNQLSGAVELEMGSDWFNSGGKMVADGGFDVVGFVVEGSRPICEGFKAEGEGVLSRCEFVAVMDHGLVFGK